MKVGVIGAGTMGQGIAKAFAMVDGYTVALCDIKQEWAEGGKDKIAKGYARLVEKGKMTQEQVDGILDSITPGLKEDLCADCDLIVEAAFENMEVKKTTFSELDKICKPECIFASNTSSLSITEIGNGLTRPMIGMHFFNPADRMKLVEVIAGVNTPDETVEEIIKISKEMLYAQGQVAKENGNDPMEKNFERAAELVDVPDDVILKMYDKLRPNRSTKLELVLMAQELLEKYNAKNCARLVMEAAEVYEKRGILL